MKGSRTIQDSFVDALLRILALVVYLKYVRMSVVMNNCLSYDLAVIQWIMSCHKLCYDYTLHNTFGGNKLSHADVLDHFI